MSATTTVTAIGTATWYEFFSAEMRRTRSSFAGATTNFYVINEV